MSISDQNAADALDDIRETGAEPDGACGGNGGERTATPRFVTVCAWCENVKLGRRWLRLEEAVGRLHMVERPESHQFTHGICPTCLEPLLARRVVHETVLTQHRAA